MEPRTIVDVLRYRAETEPDRLALGFIVDGDDQTATLSYAELDAGARRIAARIGARLAPGARALLVYEPGLEFIRALFGCFYAGIVAVPLYPPTPARLAPSLAHLSRIAAETGAEAVLTSRLVQPLLRGDESSAGGALGAIERICTEVDEGAPRAGGRERRVTGSTVAFIQYTSGSTSGPMGVVLRHESLLANQRHIQSAFEFDRDCIGANWLPLYHDMGLIGCVLQPIFVGFPSYLMSPLHFMQHPIRWLRAITRLRATVAGGPNFAYELCVRRARPEELGQLDLRSWTLAFNGAEPIRPSTLRDFARVFGPAGFDASAHFPCYGLAETTLLVACARHRAGFRTLKAAVPALEQDRRFAAAEDGREIVSCGGPREEHEIRIVDPETRRPLGDGRVGEIWVRGPSVASGYWNREANTHSTFGATLADEPSVAHLRTGDLGFVWEGELYVTGRAKELIIVRGRNIYAHDVEDAAQSADARLRFGCGAAFAVRSEDGEGIGLVQETTTRERPELEALSRRIRESVFDQLQVELSGVVLVPPRAIPKTSSGKVRRAACREALRGAAMAILHEEWRHPEPTA